MIIRIDALNSTALPSREHEFAAMKEGLTVKLNVGQILDMLVGDAPEQLNTFVKLAAALGDDANFYATVTDAIAGKLAIAENLNDLADKAVARGNLGAADAANLTTGLLPAARVPATLAADQAFRRGNILAAVSQSSGVPTGGVIERGSNTNGQYVRFADGTQICWNLTNNVNMVTTTVQGSGYQASATTSVTFPAAFSTPPAVAPMSLFDQPSNGVAGTARAWVSTAAVSTSTANLMAHAFTSDGAAWNAYTAVGRWF